MTSSRPWPFEDDDRPSGSVRPLSKADLQAILATSRMTTRMSCWPEPARTGPWWQCGCGPALAGQAAPPTPDGDSP